MAILFNLTLSLHADFYNIYLVFANSFVYCYCTCILLFSLPVSDSLFILLELTQKSTHTIRGTIYILHKYSYSLNNVITPHIYKSGIQITYKCCTVSIIKSYWLFIDIPSGINLIYHLVFISQASV